MNIDNTDIENSDIEISDIENNDIENNDIENSEIFAIVEEEVLKMGFLQRLVSVFVAPVKLMQNLKSHPVIAAMLFFVMALSLLTLPFLSRITEITTNKLSEIMLVRYGQDFLFFIESAQAAANTAATSAITTISAALGVIIIYPIMCLLKALVLFIITKIAHGEAKYRQYVSMYAHVLLITTIGTLLTTPIMVSLGTLLDVSSLAAVFMPNGDFSMMPFNLLSAITLFSIWGTIIAGIGVKEINGFSTTKSIVIIALMFVLSTLATALMAGSSLFIMDLSYKAMGF